MPISNISSEVREAMMRRAQGQTQGRLTDVNPPTVPGPATMPTPSLGMGGTGMPPSPTATPQGVPGGVPDGVSGAVPGKDSNDAMIIEGLLTYLRKKVL